MGIRACCAGLAIVAVLAGCGGGSGGSGGVAPSAYLTSMCGAVTQLKSDGVTQARLFGSGVAGVHTIAQDKVATVKYLSTLALAAHRTVPTSSLHAFQAATYRIGANLQTAVQIVNNGITGLRSPAIDAVEPTVPVCVALR